jgi:hypothetical protein
MFTAKGSGLCLGVPWAPHFLRDRNGIMCVAAGFCVAEIIHHGIMCNTCLGVVWAPLLLGQRHARMSTAKGSDVRPGVPRAPPLSASFAWVGHTPWCALGPHLFVMQVWENVHCQGIGCMLWRPSGSTSFAWQARDNVCAAKAWDRCTGAPPAPPL